MVTIFRSILLVFLCLQIFLNYSLLTLASTSSTPITRKFLADHSDQILLNKIYNPSFTAPAPNYNAETKLYEFSSGILLTAFNSTIGIASTTSGRLKCDYFPTINSNVNRKSNTGSTINKSELLHPISLQVTPYINQPPHHPNAAEYNPSSQIGSYTPSFLSSSSSFYNYLSSDEITEILASPDFDPTDPVPWALFEQILEQSQTIRRQLQIEFVLDPSALQSTSPTNRQISNQQKKQFILPHHDNGYIQCYDIIFTSNIPAVPNYFLAQLFSRDFTRNTILYSNTISMSHHHLDYNYERKTITTTFNMTINMEDHPNFLLSQQHNLKSNNKSPMQYYSYLHDSNTLHMELYLPFIKYANSMNGIITDVEIIRDQTIYRDIISNEHNQAIFDRSSTDFQLSIRQQCTQQQSQQSTNTTSTSLPPKDTLCQDNGEIGAVGARTFILTAQFSPTIISFTAMISYTFHYIDLVKYLSWESIATRVITPNTLRYYDILAINGFPTHSHTDLFDMLSSQYRHVAHFYTHHNYTITYPSPIPSIPNSNPLFGFELPHNAKRDQTVIPNIFTQTGINLESSPLSRSFPIPDLLTRSMSPQLQQLFFKKLRALELTNPQINTLRSTQLVEWGIQLPTNSLCPVVTTDDFISDDITGFPRIKIILWLDCILSV